MKPIEPFKTNMPKELMIPIETFKISIPKELIIPIETFYPKKNDYTN
jgi:hypothetical protein